MKAEVANKWIEALRSGEYQQAEGQLRKCGDNWEVDPSDSAYCCLGVLCDLYAQEHSHAEWGGGLDRGELFLSEEFHLPREVREWAGMRSDNGNLGTETTIVHLTSDGHPVAETSADNLVDLNDSGASFAEIADVIAQRKEEL